MSNYEHKQYSKSIPDSAAYPSLLEELRHQREQEQLLLAQKMQQAKMQMQMEMEVAMEKKSSNQALIERLMEMQKKYIDRLETENARLMKELDKHVNG